jgi:hypothetical protein
MMLVLATSFREGNAFGWLCIVSNSNSMRLRTLTVQLLGGRCGGDVPRYSEGTPRGPCYIHHLDVDIRHHDHRPIPLNNQ